MRGLKYEEFGGSPDLDEVAPFMGAWIEICSNHSQILHPLKSHPLWVRGLKLVQLAFLRRQRQVAPFMGAWIEIST